MFLTPEWVSEQGPDAPLLTVVADAFLTNPVQSLAVAVSGGGDSMALLDLLRRLAVAEGIALHAVTIDHGLRPAAADEIALIATYCAAHAIPHDVLRWEGTLAEGNMLAAAREARYRLLSQWAQDHSVEAVALGHTQDDVAETFLMRLSRKAGVEGLAHMAPWFVRDNVRFVRPILGQGRADLRGYLRRKGITWVDDPTNHDDHYQRTRAREALALLAPLGIDAPGLADVAASLEISRQALAHATIEAGKSLVRVDRGDALLIERPRPDIPWDIQRRLCQSLLQWIGGRPYPPRRAEMDNLAVARQHMHKTTLAGCLVTFEADGTTRFAREAGAVAALEVAVEGTTTVWDRWHVTGPVTPGAVVRALGDAVKDCPDWRDTGLPRESLRASPSVWFGEALIAAPLAGFGAQWSAQIVTSFTDHLVSH